MSTTCFLRPLVAMLAVLSVMCMWGLQEALAQDSGERHVTLSEAIELAHQHAKSDAVLDT